MLGRTLSWCCLIVLGLWTVEARRANQERIAAPKQAPVVEPGCYLTDRREPVKVVKVGDGLVNAKWLSGQLAAGKRCDDGSWWFGGTFGVMHLDLDRGQRVGKWWSGDGVERREVWVKLVEEK